MATQKALTLLDTTVGKKAALAVTGVILFGFVIGHMLGNLQVLLGPDVFNAYAAGIKEKPILLWGVRTVLLVSVLVHTSIVLELYGKSVAAAYLRVWTAASTWCGRQRLRRLGRRLVLP